MLFHTLSVLFFSDCNVVMLMVIFVTMSLLRPTFFHYQQIYRSVIICLLSVMTFGDADRNVEDRHTLWCVELSHATVKGESHPSCLSQLTQPTETLNAQYCLCYKLYFLT